MYSFQTKNIWKVEERIRGPLWNFYYAPQIFQNYLSHPRPIWRLKCIFFCLPNLPSQRQQKKITLYFLWLPWNVIWKSFGYKISYFFDYPAKLFNFCKICVRKKWVSSARHNFTRPRKSWIFFDLDTTAKKLNFCQLQLLHGYVKVEFSSTLM